jgi:hypothetical protein
VSVENGWDELWLGVKCQSNPEIAGSPRNVLRYSLRWCCTEVEHWMDAGPPQGYQLQPNSECRPVSLGVRQWGISFIVERETAQTVR